MLCFEYVWCIIYFYYIRQYLINIISNLPLLVLLDVMGLSCSSIMFLLILMAKYIKIMVIYKNMIKYYSIVIITMSILSRMNTLFMMNLSLQQDIFLVMMC